MQANGILASFRTQIAKRHADWHPERQLQGAVAAYNSGVGNVQTLDGMDKGTTGNDYSNDVWARARFFAGKMGSAVPATPSETVAALKPIVNVLVPAPLLDAVADGLSKLQRGQQGDAVKELQEMLMKLKYLELTDEQKATGFGLFGPKTETALQSFQRDVYLPPSGVLEVLTHDALGQILGGAVKRDADNQIGVVRRMQDRLVALKKLSKTVIGKGYGAFGPKTEAALKEFQKEVQLAADGVYTLETYLALRASAPSPPPVIDVGAGDDKAVNTQLPNAGPGFFAKGGATKRSVQFCTERTLNRLMAFAAVWMQKHPDRPLRIGEMSVQGGGKFGAHVGEGHLRGFAVDIGLFRKDGQNLGTTFRDKAVYDQRLAKELVAALDESPNVFLMIFNDPEVTASPKLRRGGPHNDHVHVEFRKRS
jgi:peptidoglycan hydrolase-like protein with peptidoglycan-binding domain